MPAQPMRDRSPRVLAVGALAVAAWPVVRRARERALEHRRGDPPVTRADDGVELHVETTGGGDSGLTVVLVHGYGASLQEWCGQRDALAPNVRLVLFDQRGHGRSGWGHHRRATLEQLGRDLRAVVEEHCRRQRVVLVGHSMGGMAVLALAGSHPELFGDAVVGVALISTSAGRLMQSFVPGVLAHGLRRSHALAPALQALWFAAPLLDRLSPFGTATGRRLLRRRLFGRGGCAPSQLDSVQQHFQDTRTSVLAAFAPALLHHDLAAALQVLRGLPVLVLAGADDATIPAAHSRRLEQELDGDCELVVVLGAGHMVNVTHADQVNRALGRLLEQAARQMPTAVHGGRDA